MSQRTKGDAERAWQTGLVLRGTTSGIEIVLDGETFESAWREVEERLAQRPGFYRGSRAMAVCAVAPADEAEFRRMIEGISSYGIVLEGVYGEAKVESLAGAHGTPFLGALPRAGAPRLAPVQRRIRAAEPAPLTHAARSLDADFAGARADFVKRRERIVAARERAPVAAVRPAGPVAAAATAAAVPPIASTLYHRGDLRGGQALRHAGTIVVVGDVNPGAELTASGDILVFGSLRGTAHAGAHGDATARVIALDLQPTQLRIATSIAAGADARRTRGVLAPEVAFIEHASEGASRIAIAPYDDARVPR